MEHLQYDLCLGCAEQSPKGRGIIAMIQHSCALNQVTYRGGGLSLRVLIDFFARRNPIQELKDMLLVYPHFKKMPNYSTASLLDKKIYAIIREMEIKQMKRMRAYIDIEEEYYQTGKLKQ